MMKEFVSKLEAILPAEELVLPSTPAFGRYKPFLEHAIAHPAKANTKLLEFLVRTFTEPGDVVLDPMAGSGSTGVVAALHGRNAVQVELERKFYCFDDQTEILTRDGWKRYNEVTFNDEIATLNEEGYIGYQKPTNIFIYNYKGKMYHLETPYVSLMVTPNHKLLVDRSSRSNKSVKCRRWHLVEAKEVYGHFARFKKDGKWRGEYIEHFILPAVKRGSSWGDAEPKRIPMNEWLKFFGLWLAEGSTTKRKDSRGYDNYIVNFRNTNKSIIQEYVELARKFGFNPFLSKNGNVQIYNKQLYSYLAQFGKAHDKFIPREIKSLASEQLKILFEYLMKGDGHRGRGGNWYLTVSKKLADDFQEILLKINLSGNVYTKDMSKYGRARLQYRISVIQKCLTPSINHHRNKWRNERWTDYDGVVWCVEVPDHIVYIRRNGKAVWTGNSWMEKARENVEKHFTLTPKGRIVNICGDARRLSELLCRADVAITSPPHGDTYLGGDDPEKRKERLIKAGHDPKEFLGGRARNAVLKHYDEVDVCITSPPYSDAISKQGGPVGVRNVGISTITAREYSQNPENIGNLPLGEISAIITSPPYADAKRGGEADKERMAEKWDKAFKEKGETWNSWGKTWHTPGRLRGLEALGSGYSKSEQNIGNLPLGEISAVITSPPYEGSLEGTTRHIRGGIASRDPALAQTGTYATTLSEATKQGVPIGYSPNLENIGNLKRETYLEAMLKVYSEMWKVLKPNGLAIIIVKPFIRNKKVVDLPWHTWLLMAKVGFQLEKLYKLRLKSQSFWRILYARKFPDAERICHEYIIVACKSGEMV